MVKDLQKDGEISEDDLHRARKSIQDMTDKVVKDIDTLLDTKEKEIMEG